MKPRSRTLLTQRAAPAGFAALGIALALQASPALAQRPRYVTTVPAVPVQTYPAPSYAAPSYATPSFAAPAYVAPTYPAATYPAQAVGVPIGGPAQVVFGSRVQTEILSNRLSEQVNAICLEMYNNHQTNPRFQEMYREMYSVLQDTQRVRDLVRQGYHRNRNADDRIERELYDMDRIVSNVEQELRSWRPVDRNPTDREVIPRQLSLVQSTLRELMDDYGVRSQIVRAPVVVEPVITPVVAPIQPVVVPRPVGPYRGGFR